MNDERPSDLVRRREELRARIAPVINRAVWTDAWQVAKLSLLFLAPMAVAFASLSLESTAIRIVGMLTAATLMFLSLFVIAYRQVLAERATAERFHLVCAKCDGELMNCASSDQLEAAERFPDWSPMDAVPLRCWNCGAFVEEYVKPELAALIGMAEVETDATLMQQ